ncbi:CpaD family pilus assembly lipoprotein [Desertibaculum subflavum]|uniref:CpaD family pilus assembly lipoprotein n=1 Tax=Desertibaculum subflavum TaxID=2268458 RepID=UPI000E665CA3
MTRGKIFFAILLLSLGACAREEAAWTAVEAPNRLQVDWRSEAFVASFPAGAAELAPDERAKLARFLVAGLRTGDERITLSPPPDADRALTDRRVNHLRQIVAGAAPRRPITVAPIADGRLAAGSAMVVIGRYIVSTPSCPNWRKPSGTDSANQPSSNIGCANETNLGLMVADPADLVVGRELDNAEAEAMNHGIRRYRENKVPALPKDNSTLTTGK